jgi:serine/threonine protein phosphatase 1
MRLFAVPDIHGRKDLLVLLLAKLWLEEKLDMSRDKLIFLGDMVDRGPDSKGVLDAVRSLQDEHPDTVIVLAGNHEELMIDGCSNSAVAFDLWIQNGGGRTIHSFGFSWTDPSFSGQLIPKDYLKWLKSLRLSHEEKGFFFSHAPVPKETYRMPQNRGKPFTREELTWTYHGDEAGIAKVHDNGVLGVCGHIHAIRKKIFEPRLYDHYLFLDAGCGCADEAPLFCCEVVSGKMISVGGK